LRVLGEHSSPVRSVVWSPDGSRVVSSSSGQGGASSVKLWNVSGSDPAQWAFEKDILSDLVKGLH
jgi:WD40 repeat protein